MKADRKVQSWFLFVGVIMLLIGIYATLRTGINLFAYKNYPSGGVIPLNFSGMPFYSQNEEDCYNLPPIMTDRSVQEDGSSALSVQEQRQLDIKSCLTSITKERDNSKTNDIAQSSLFLFMGLGLIIARKFLPS